MTANRNGHRLVVLGSRERVPDEEDRPQSPIPLHVSNQDPTMSSAINREVRGNYYEGISGGDYARYINGTYNDLRPAAPDRVACEHARWKVPFICLGLALFTVIVIWAHRMFRT